MYLACRKECELPLPAVPLVKMLTMLGNFTGFFHMDWHHLVHSLKIQECKKKCIMYRKFIVNHYEIEIFTTTTKINEEWTSIDDNVRWDISPIKSLSMNCIIIKTFIKWNYKSREIDVHYLHSYITYNTRYMISLTLFSIYIFKFLSKKKNGQMCLMTSYND